MTKFNYLKLTKTKKIRYLKLFQKNAAYIVFLHGFMSDLTGKKPKEFYNFAKKNNRKIKKKLMKTTKNSLPLNSTMNIEKFKKVF